MTPADLLRENGPSLFRRAREVAGRLPTRFTMVMHPDTSCSLEPQCLHCNWRGREPFHKGYRRRLSQSQVVETAIQAERDGFDSLYMATGCMGEELPDYLYGYVQAIKRVAGIDVFGMFGAVNRSSLARLKDAGMAGIWCGLESPNERIFSLVRPGDSLRSRMETLRIARELGMKSWSGFILGFGESLEDVAKGIQWLRDLEVDRVHFGVFHPAPFTEMEQQKSLNHPYWIATVQAATRVHLGEVELFTQYESAQWGFRAGCNGVLSPSAYLPIPPREFVRLREMRQNVNMRQEG